MTVPTSLKVLYPIIGATRGLFTLVEHEPDRNVRYAIDFPRAAGEVQLVVDGNCAKRAVELRGALHAKAKLARLASVPFAGAADLVIARAARRTLARAAEAVRMQGKSGMSRSLS